MKRKLVLHIGLRKTGSSALQEILAKEATAIRKHEIEYPDRMAKFPAHQELAWSLMDPKPNYISINFDKGEVYDTYCGIIDRNVEAGLSTLLSSEDLSLLTFNFAALEYIKLRFSTYNPLIVFYMRSPIEYHISNYKHALIAGCETRSFADYIFARDNLIFANPSIHDQIWRSVFGQKNVRTLKYEAEKFRQTSIYSDFMKSVFNVTIEEKYLDYRSNVGIPNESINYVLALNRSNLPDEELRSLKKLIRSAPLSSNQDGFLREQLSDAEIKNLKRIYDDI